MMKLFVLASLVSAIAAFVPTMSPKMTTQLDAVSRRDALTGLLASGSWMLASEPAQAFSQQLDDYQWEPQQQATDGLLDLNSAFVVGIE